MIKIVKGYPTTKNVKEVRAFLDLASFYRRLVPDFAKFVKLLTTLTRKDQKFIWGPSQQEAFEKLKQTLQHASFGIPKFRAAVHPHY
jgi:hypothetical protein